MEKSQENSEIAYVNSISNLYYKSNKLYKSSIKNYRLPEIDCVEKIPCLGIDAYTVRTEAILIYTANKNIKCIVAKDFNNLSEDKNTTIILNNILKLNDLIWDIQSAEYLLKFDKQNITPYLIRFCNGKFTKEEIGNSNILTRQKITAYAKAILEKYGIEQ